MPLTTDQRATVRAIKEAGKIGDADRGRVAAWLSGTRDLTAAERGEITAALAIPRATDNGESARSIADARAALLASPEAVRGLNAAAGREGLDSLTFARERLSRGDS